MVNPLMATSRGNQRDLNCHHQLSVLHYKYALKSE